MSKRVCQRCREIVTKDHQCRGGTVRRGYDSDWKKFRAWFVAKHKAVCRDCGASGTNVVIEVHHIQRVADRPDLRLHEANCMCLCKTCHSKRTARGE